jgi:inosose dehydratase
LVQLNALRVGEIEMSRGEFMLMNHPTEELFRSARTKLDRAEIHCVSYYTATIKEDQDLENAVRFARLLASSHVTGDAKDSILKRIDQRFTQEQLTFGIHSHYFKGAKFAHESPEDVLNPLAGLSNTVGATAGVGHFALRPRSGRRRAQIGISSDTGSPQRYSGREWRSERAAWNRNF